MASWRREVIYHLNKLDSDLSAEPIDPENEEKGQARRAYVSILGILSGSHENISSFADSDWKMRLVGLAVYAYPTMSATDVSELLLSGTGDFNAAGSSSLDMDVEKEGLDGVLWALLDGDVNGAIRKASDLDWWITAHMGDILDRAGLLQPADLLLPSASPVPGSRGEETSFAEWLMLNFVDRYSFCMPYHAA